MIISWQRIADIQARSTSLTILPRAIFLRKSRAGRRGFSYYARERGAGSGRAYIRCQTMNPRALLSRARPVITRPRITLTLVQTNVSTLLIRSRCSISLNRSTSDAFICKLSIPRIYTLLRARTVCRNISVQCNKYSLVIFSGSSPWFKQCDLITGVPMPFSH